MTCLQIYIYVSFFAFFLSSSSVVLYVVVRGSYYILYLKLRCLPLTLKKILLVGEEGLSEGVEIERGRGLVVVEGMIQFATKAVVAETILVVVEVSHGEEVVGVEEVPPMEMTSHPPSFCFESYQIDHKSSSCLDAPQMSKHLGHS